MAPTRGSTPSAWYGLRRFGPRRSSCSSGTGWGGGTGGYDGSNRLSTITDRRAKATSLAYGAGSGNAAGKLVTVTAPAVPIFNEGTVSPVTTLSPWQKLGVPYDLTGGTPATPVLLADVKGSVTDPGGHSTTFTVDRWGQPVVTTEPLSWVTSVTYDANGLARKIVHPTGAVDTLDYATNGLVSYVQRVGASATNIRYAAFAQPDSISGDSLPTTRPYIGFNGRVDSVRVGGTSGTVVKYTYDSRGRVVTAVDALNHLLAQTWYQGVNENRSKDSLPGGRVTQYVSDVYGRDSVLIPSEPTLLWPKTYYDLLNRPTSLVNPPGTIGTISLVYGDSLHLTRVTDPMGQVYEFSYNALGWLTARKDPAALGDTLKYSRDGEVKQFKNRRNQNIDYTYDALHRPTNKSGTNTPAEAWSYSANGRDVTGTSPAATVLSYSNVRGQPDSVKPTFGFGDRWVRYTYTGAGWLSTVNGPFGKVHNYNTARGTLDTLKVGSVWTTFGFNGDLQANTTKFWGGDIVNRSFSTVHDAGQISTTAGYWADVWRELEYDVGERVKVQKNGGSAGAKYTYDVMGRLSCRKRDGSRDTGS